MIGLVVVFGGQRFVAAQVHLKVEIRLVAAAEVGKIAAALQMGHFGARVAAVEVFADGRRDGTVVEDVHDGDQIVLQVVDVDVRAATVQGQP